MFRPGMHSCSIFNNQHVATRRNRVVKRAQRCAMLRLNVAIVWPELANAGPTMLGYDELKCCDRLAGALRYA